MKNEQKAAEPQQIVVVKPANIHTTVLRIKGSAPLVINRFWKKDEMMAAQSVVKSGRAQRKPRNFKEDFKRAQHVSTSGWQGIYAGAFRMAMIDACRTVGIKMPIAKLGLWILADGIDREDGTPLVKILAKAPEMATHSVRNFTGVVDIRARPMWRAWEADVRVQFDADIISAESIVNLLDRAGLQVGICEGRPFSKSSAGMGWGTFRVVGQKTVTERS